MSLTNKITGYVSNLSRKQRELLTDRVEMVGLLLNTLSDLVDNPKPGQSVLHVGGTDFPVCTGVCDHLVQIFNDIAVYSWVRKAAKEQSWYLQGCDPTFPVPGSEKNPHKLKQRYRQSKNKYVGVQLKQRIDILRTIHNALKETLNLQVNKYA